MKLLNDKLNTDGENFRIPDLSFWWGLYYKGAGDFQFWIIWHREETLTRFQNVKIPKHTVTVLR